MAEPARDIVEELQMHPFPPPVKYGLLNVTTMSNRLTADSPDLLAISKQGGW